MTTPRDLREAALAYHANGWPVIPVGPDKRPVCKWGDWLKRPQSEAEVRSLPWETAHGVAVLTYPGSEMVVVDEDGPHAPDAWTKTGISLPETATVRTRSGGRHLIFRVPAGTPRPDGANGGPRRKVRLISADCGCPKRCGVDLLLSGYFVSVPTPQYREDPDHPFEPGTIREIPQAVLDLARTSAQSSERQATAPPVGERIPLHQRNATLTSLAGSMRRRGMSEEAILAALLSENARRCDPPLSEAEVRDIAASIGRYAPAAEPGAQTLEHLTDLGNARRLVALHGAWFRWCEAWGCFLVWDGRRWAKDDTGQVMRWAKDTARAMYAEAADTADENRRKDLGSHALKAEADAKLRAMVNVAKSEDGIAIRPADLDTDRMLLTLENGTLDLQTGCLLTHRPEDFNTKLAPVAWDPEATAPTWERFLHRILNGNLDMIGFLQRILGYSLTGMTREQVWFLLHGIGANGKSTLLRTVTDLLGDYAAWTPTRTLLARRGEQIENDLARLHGARLVAAVEADGGRRLAEALVKQVTGGDPVTGRFLYGEYFSYIPVFKLWFGTNHKPQIRGTDHAVWRRIRLLPFTVVIPEPEWDRDLGDKLRAEFPGILRWAVEGCLQWQRQGLGLPEPVRQATAEYRETMDVIGAFLGECCVMEEGTCVGATDLYRAYVAWCDAAKEPAETQTKFGEAMSERGFTRDRHRVTNRVIRLGLRLVTEQSEQSERLF